VDESDVAFVLPPEIKEGTPAYDVWYLACARANEEYRTLLGLVVEQVKDEPSATLRRKRARQTARSVLPNATETKIVVSGNARAWRHFVEMRASGSADTEIRRAAIQVLRILQAEAPALFGDYEIMKREDGTETATTSNPGV
jgi:thymidylate synthase (FAD)